jgi:AraC-like DNA-binding protein
MLGWGLFFHPDLLRENKLVSSMDGYTFFSYEATEALHLSEKEKQILFDCVQKIKLELEENIDFHSQRLMVTNIELLLNYCLRFYGRQFITRTRHNSSVVSKVDDLLKRYFASEALKEAGLPKVSFLAEQVHLSSGYLSDLLKKETGMHAQDYIHYHLIEQAKQILRSSDDSVSVIADMLGFEYPQYFSKLFKQKTGTTPNACRNQN